VSKDGKFTGYNGSRSLDIAESCPLDLKPVIAFQSFCPHFTADILSFPITIGPDEEGPGAPC